MSQAWQVTLDQIKSDNPELVGLNWAALMQYDTAVLTEMLGDVVKVERRDPSQPGKRPFLDRDLAEEKLAQISSEDFSDYEFHRTFRGLMHGRSIRQVANKTGVDKMHIHALKHGKATPTLETLEKLARGFRKHPSFFLEYRVAVVLRIFHEFLNDSPETATAWYMKTRGGR